MFWSNPTQEVKMKILCLILMLVSAAFMVVGATEDSETQDAVIQFNPLPYSYDALEPHIDAKTMEIHYDRHHRGYYRNLMNAIDGTELAGKPIEAILSVISEWPDVIRNNAGGHYNHELFWAVMSPDGGGKPEGELAEKIDDAFGSFESFQEQFNRAAQRRFGSGWAWLCVAADGTLFVTSTANQDNPLMDIAEKTGLPILGLDVWEHAYYLQYQNQRGSYIDAFWNVINWREVAARWEDRVGR
jgi:superoxide dismutase, Fe-Mn family